MTNDKNIQEQGVKEHKMQNVTKLTSIQKEDRSTDERRLIEAIFQFRKVATNNRSQNEAHTGGCIETPHY